MFGLVTLPLQLLLLLLVIVVCGYVLKGKVWSPSATVFGYNFKLTLAVPQVAFFVKKVTAVPVAPVPAPAATAGATVEKK